MSEETPMHMVGSSRSWSFRDHVEFVLAVTVIAAFGLFFYNALRPAAAGPIPDEKTGCLVQQAPSSATVVLIDNTDPFSASQIEAFKHELAGVHDAVTPWGMLTVASIGVQLPGRIIFSRCSPEKALDLVESIRRNEDWLALKKQYEDQFQQPVQALIDRMPLTTTTPRSPILQTLADVIHQLGPYWKDAPKRVLIIFSDLLENTQEFSQYDDESSRIGFAQARKSVSYIRNLHLDLQKTDIRIFYLTGRVHNAALQGSAHQKFWHELFTSYGGHLTDWVTVPVEPTKETN
jgi:hypothetical protein